MFTSPLTPLTTRRHTCAMPSLFMKLLLLCACLFTSNAAFALDLKGRLEWVSKAELRVTDGVIEKVAVTVGQHVSKGELLLRMDQREFNAAVLETKAQVARAKVNKDDADKDLERAQELYDQGLIAEEELKEMQLKQAAALAELESGKAKQTVAEIDLERTVLYAPYNGIIVEQNVWDGAVIYKNLQQKPPLAIAPNNQMIARTQVRADILRRYQRGQRAQVRFRGGQNRQAVIHRLGVEAVRIEPEGAIYELDVIFQRQPNETLRPSESVIVVLP